VALWNCGSVASWHCTGSRPAESNQKLEPRKEHVISEPHVLARASMDNFVIGFSEKMPWAGANRCAPTQFQTALRLALRSCTQVEDRVHRHNFPRWESESAVCGDRGRGRTLSTFETSHYWPGPTVCRGASWLLCVAYASIS
jgi:hypothetical protein